MAIDVGDVLTASVGQGTPVSVTEEYDDPFKLVLGVSHVWKRETENLILQFIDLHAGS